MFVHQKLMLNWLAKKVENSSIFLQGIFLLANQDFDMNT